MTDSTSTPRLLLFLAPAYALLGALGLTLAIPPGYASPVFPAAGLALAATLWFGRQALAGIWLGSAVLNLAHAWLAGALTPTTGAVAAVIATASTAQAWSGRWLVNRRQGPAWRDLEQEQDAFRFLLLGGVLACLVSATISVTGLHAAGVIGRAEVLYTWWNWYVGDTLGVLVFAPLTLCLLNRQDSLWRERRRRIVLPMLLTLGLALLAFYGASLWEQKEQDSQLQADGETIAKLITDRLITHREVLSSLQHFVEATPNFTFRQFEQFTRITLQDNPDIFALSFNDLVTHERRLEFERLMSGLSPLGPFRITERDRQKRLVRAATRPEYVAVSYIVPLSTNRQAVGFDIHSEPIRRAAIERARASNRMAVTSPITLVQEQKPRIGVLELLPVSSAPMADAREQAGRLHGFAVAVVKVDEMIDIATRGQTPDGLGFHLIDPHAPQGQRLLYRSAMQGAAASSTQVANWKTGLRMGDRNWELAVFTTESYRLRHRPWLAWVVGVAGLMFATLLQTLMLGMTGRTAVIQRQNEALKENQTELLRKDRALMQSEKMASIGQLAAGVAHEINNPLGFISCNMRTLSQYFSNIIRYDIIRQENSDELSPPTQKTLEESRESLDIEYILTEGVDLIKESLIGAERVCKIVLDLKNFSRVDAPEYEAVELTACLESALTICYNELKYVATIRKEYESAEKVLGHPGRLNQVFLNLLVNAGQAIVTPGEIVLRCWHDDAFVHASVSDTGSGIPKEIIDRIFDPFYTTKGVGEGTGLGLSISYEIIKNHQGELLVESVVGTGSTFTVKLPRTPEILP